MALANTPVLQALCTLNDVDIDAIEMVPTQYSAQPLLAGEVDCLLCWETDLPVAMAVQGVESTHDADGRPRLYACIRRPTSPPRTAWPTAAASWWR